MIDKSKVLVTGGRGMMGSRIPFGIKLDRDDLDIRREDSVNAAFAKHEPQLVIHLAALKDKAYCQAHPADAYNVNVLGTLNVAKACRSRDIPLIFASSYYVFDCNARAPYRENDLAHPINVYGKTKFAGELIVEDLVKRHAIVRLGLVYGEGIEDSFINVVAKRIAKGESIAERDDRKFSLTSIRGFLDGISLVIEDGLHGLFHLAESGGPSYYETATFIKEQLNPAATVTVITPGPDDAAAPPRGGGFGVLMPSAVFSPRSWQAALSDYLLSLKTKTAGQ